jgi:hypothetical protein
MLDEFVLPANITNYHVRLLVFSEKNVLLLPCVTIVDHQDRYKVFDIMMISKRYSGLFEFICKVRYV